MTPTRTPKLSTRVSAVGAVVTAIILGCQLVSWATDACQVPNPSEVFCTENETPITCSDVPELLCEAEFDAMERKQFPDGAVSSESGTTKEEESDCWRKKWCVWDDVNTTCKSTTTWGPYNPGDKTVVGDNQCPTDEE